MPDNSINRPNKQLIPFLDVLAELLADLFLLDGHTSNDEEDESSFF